jgi:pimeloyl-ACP methyl ester carboxylesterase
MSSHIPQPVVVMLHASGSHARQWNRLAELLQARFRVHAVDLHGHGGTPPWDMTRPLRLHDEVALFERLIESAPGGVHLVGHSYGGAVALKAAALHPRRVRSVAVYEPVLFPPAARDRPVAPRGPPGDGARHDDGEPARGGPQRDRGAPLHRFLGRAAAAGRRCPRRARRCSPRRCRRSQRSSTRSAPTAPTATELGWLRAPALCLTGARTRACTRRVGELLQRMLPAARHETLAEMGHMGPLTHAEPVARRLAAFVDAQAACGVEAVPEAA